MKAPVTDTSLGIRPDASGKFRDVRRKAHDEYIERAKRRKKDPTIPVPKHKIGDEIVTSGGYQKRHYHLIEVVDFQKSYSDFDYFGIVHKTTDPEMVERIGRLIKIGDHGFFSCAHIENIPADSVKWLVPTKGAGL